MNKSGENKRIKGAGPVKGCSQATLSPILSTQVDDSSAKPPKHIQFAAWQMRKLGYTIKQTAQMLDVSTTTIVDWDKIVDKYFDDLPQVRTAVDAMTTMIPRAIGLYSQILSGPDKRLAKEAARDVLISTKIITDRQTVDLVDDSKHSDSDLIAEAERIMLTARSKVSAGSDNE